MDVRWSRLLAGGLWATLVGCTGLQTRPASDAAALAPQPVPQPAVAAGDGKPSKLKPSTLVTMGALKEQAADDPNRPAADAEQLRYQARMEYLKALETDAKFLPAYLALARSYAATDEREKALATFRRAAAASPKDAAVPFERGTAQARWKDWPGAVESLQMAAKLDPENKQYAKTLGLTLARAGRTDEAYAALAQCMNEAEARTNVARMLKHVQQPDASRLQTELALKANPDYGPARDLLKELSGPQAAAHAEPAKPAPGALPASVAAQAKPVARPRVKPVLLDNGLAPVQVGFEPGE